MADATITHRNVRTNGIDMHIAEAGEGNPVIFCHGFPELWYSWRHQIPAVAAAGYHAVAPDQRGYGRTDRPDAIADYDIVHLTDDMLGLLDALGEEKAVFVGHDWGAPVVWGLAQRAPERVEAVVGMSVAFTPRGAQSIIDVLKQLMGEQFFYILYFQEPGKADADLGSNPREVLRRFLSAIGGGNSGAFMRSLPAATTTFFDWIPPAEKLADWLTPEDLDVFATEFERTGFTGGINWYRNMHRNWEITEHLAEVKIEMPALFVAGEEDPVLQMANPAGMDGWVTDLRGKVILPGAGHWVQQEKPAEVNAVLLDFLAGIAEPHS
jgi:pimeloyl-ACP methyl ester carboxylesterase